MTEPEFLKQSFSSKTLIEYLHPRMEKPVLCSVTSVDFDEQIIDLTIIEDPYRNDIFSAHIRHCTIFKRDKKIIKL